ncbi:hypothetical protein ACQEUU_21025 [Nonomuraea sp. CA-218870]|uniref:hypothetical protein n=1 Tax=Nonomuraea sp. CA-218870 TaxID=3239998 RepID=UPI003D8BA21A
MPVSAAPWLHPEYGLTGLGQSLVDGPLRALGRWIQDHGDELVEAQEQSVRDVLDPRETTTARRAHARRPPSFSRP